MKRIALSLLVLLPALAFAADPATNAPAATLSRADVDASVLAKLDRIIVPEFEFKDADICDVVSRLGDCSREFDDETAASERGETFERWRFTILPDIGGRYDLIGEWMDFFGQLGVSWPPGTYAERSGDDGLVVRNTPENLNLIRMIFGALSVNVLRGDPVVLEDAPATPSPAVDAHGLDAVHPEIRIDALVLQIGSPTNRESATDWYYRALLGADPALFPEADRPAVACYRGTLDAARAAAVSDGNAHILGMPSAVFGDGCKAEVSLLDIDGEPGKPAVTNGVRLSVRPLVCRGGTPLLRLTAEASVFAGDDTAETEELGLALEPGAAAVFAPPPAGDCRVLVLLFPDDSWSHAADPATNAPAATPAAAFDTTLFAAFGTRLAAAFATNVPCWPPPASPSFDEVLHALPDFASFRTGRGWGVPTEPLPPELEAAVRESLRRAVRTDTPPEALRFGTERETWPEDGWCVDAHWHTAAFEARFPGRGFCPFGDGSGGSYSERFLAYRSPDSVEDALFALFPGTYRAPGLAALLDRAHPPSGVAEETHADSPAEPESHAESAETAEP